MEVSEKVMGKGGDLRAESIVKELEKYCQRKVSADLDKVWNPLR